MVGRSSLLRERKELLNAVTVFLASAVGMCVVFGILSGVDRYVYLWPLTGLQLGFLLPNWTRRGVRMSGQAGGVLGVFAGGLAMGLPFWFAVVVAAISGLDVWIAGAILSRGVSGFEDLKFRKNLQLFAVAAIVAPVVAGVISGAFVAFLVRGPVVESSAISILSDSLGLAVVLPVLLFLLTGKYRFPSQLAPHLKRGFPVLILFVAVAALVFWQTTNPFLFMVFPTMLLVVLGFGLEGSVFVSVSLTVIACYATAHGHGPILPGHSDPIPRLIVLQLFLWMSIATALPMGALLDEHRRAEIAVDEATVVYQTLLENAEDMIVLSSIDGNHRYVSAASERLTGWTPAEYLAIDRLSTFHPDDRDIARLVIESMLSGKQEHMFRYRLAQKEGGWRWVQAVARAYFDGSTGKVRGYVGTVRDISAIKQTEEAWSSERQELAFEKHTAETLARTDALTKLPNRRAFDEAIEEQVLSSRLGGGKAALLMIDVDFFKQYNDTYGHSAGDACLQKIAAALEEKASRTHDLVTRWGGEEFGVLLAGADVVGAELVASAMLERVRGLAIVHAGHPSGFVTISIGIAELEGYSEAASSLWVQRADRALYMSKRSGKNCMTVGQDFSGTGTGSEALVV